MIYRLSLLMQVTP